MNPYYLYQQYLSQGIPKEMLLHANPSHYYIYTPHTACHTGLSYSDTTHDGKQDGNYQHRLTKSVHKTP